MKLIAFSTILTGYLLSFSASAEQISSFTSDGCSAFPDGKIEHQTLWLNCCIQHDLAYWKGGSYEERERADKQLEQCVSNVGEEEIGSLMYAGVRAGGSPYLPTPYRWGYGWPFPRGYQVLTDAEKESARQQLRAFIQMLETAEHSF